MSTKEDIGVDKIAEEQIPYYLRNKKKFGGGRNGGGGGGDYNIDFDVRLGEDINAGYAISVQSDGLWYKATITASNNKPASAILVENGTTGQIVKARTIKEISIIGVTFVVGKTVWLSSGTPNLTTTLPTMTSGNRKQRLGRAKTASVLMIEIETSVVIE